MRPASRSLWFCVSVMCVAVLLAGCGGGRKGPSEREARMYMRGLEGRTTVLRPGPDANAAYAEAMALKAKGDCAGAIPKLRKVAEIGPGYEGAQTALGECIVQTAGAKDSTADYMEGLTWLLRAAEAGWPEAQGRLAFAYALGPSTVRNTDEAAYWLALYRTNTGQSRVGFVPMPADQLAAVDAAIPAAAKAAGEKRAETWQRKVWMPPNPQEAPGIKSEPARRRGNMRDD